VPTNRFGSPELPSTFVDSRRRPEDFLKTSAACVITSGQPMGKLDGYEFVLLIAAHSERHTKQINK